MKKYSVLIVVLGLFGTVPAFAAEPPPTEVALFNPAQMENAFAKGVPLLVNSRYKVQTGRRMTAPGAVEVHDTDTDIFYVVEGTATIVTGGVVVGAKTTGPAEIRGDKIMGGTRRTLEKGAVIVIPKGTPHWFTEVSNPFLYFVIKVTE